MWVISLAYASDKDTEDLKISWKTNVEVWCAALFLMFHRKINFSSKDECFIVRTKFKKKKFSLPCRPFCKS